MAVACVTRRPLLPRLCAVPSCFQAGPDAQIHGILWKILFNKNNNKYHGGTISSHKEGKPVVRGPSGQTRQPT